MYVCARGEPPARERKITRVPFSIVRIRNTRRERHRARTPHTYLYAPNNSKYSFSRARITHITLNPGKTRVARAARSGSRRSRHQRALLMYSINAKSALFSKRIITRETMLDCRGALLCELIIQDIYIL